MPRNDQLIRQWRLLRAVEASRRGLTVAELHEDVAELGSLRTVYRDLEALMAAGFPLYQGEDHRWRLLTPTEGGPAIPVHPTEMVALLLSEQALAPLVGSALAEPLVELRSKLEATLAPGARAWVDRLRGGLLATVPAAGDYAGRRTEIAVVERAIREHRRLRLVHFSAHRRAEIERTVEPYGVWYVDGALYLVAYDLLRRDHRKFLVDRIHHATVLDEPFDPDPTFDLQAYVGRGFRVWHGAVHRVVVEFSPTLAHLPHERRYHRTQTVEDLPDQTCRVTFDAAGLPDLAAWVASFGGLVRAIEPVELVEIVRGLHQRGLEIHMGTARDSSGLRPHPLSCDDTAGRNTSNGGQDGPAQSQRGATIAPNECGVKGGRNPIG